MQHLSCTDFVSVLDVLCKVESAAHLFPAVQSCRSQYYC